MNSNIPSFFNPNIIANEYLLVCLNTAPPPLSLKIWTIYFVNSLPHQQVQQQKFHHSYCNSIKIEVSANINDRSHIISTKTVPGIYEQL